RGIRLDTLRIALDAEQELGRNEQAIQCELDARIEALLGALVIEVEQRQKVALADVAPVCATRERLENALCAVQVRGRARIGSLGLADEDWLTTHRFAWTVHVIRAADLHAAQLSSGAGLGNIDARRVRPLKRQPRRLVECRRTVQERCRNNVATRRNGHT